jgi:hypothetical protein
MDATMLQPNCTQPSPKAVADEVIDLSATSVTAAARNTI